MAKRLKTFDFAIHSRTGKYPWHEWCDGTAWQAEYATDFDVKPDAFVGAIRAKAKRLGRRVQIAIVDHGAGIVVFQFETAPEAPSKAVNGNGHAKREVLVVGSSTEGPGISKPWRPTIAANGHG